MEISLPGVTKRDLRRAVMRGGVMGRQKTRKITSLALRDVNAVGVNATVGPRNPCHAWGKLARHAYDLLP